MPAETNDPHPEAPAQKLPADTAGDAGEETPKKPVRARKKAGATATPRARKPASASGTTSRTAAGPRTRRSTGSDDAPATGGDSSDAGSDDSAAEAPPSQPTAASAEKRDEPAASRSDDSMREVEVRDTARDPQARVETRIIPHFGGGASRERAAERFQPGNQPAQSPPRADSRADESETAPPASRGESEHFSGATPAADSSREQRPEDGPAQGGSHRRPFENGGNRRDDRRQQQGGGGQQGGGRDPHYRPNQGHYGSQGGQQQRGGSQPQDQSPRGGGGDRDRGNEGGAPGIVSRPVEPQFAEGIVEVSGKGFGFLREAKRTFVQTPNDTFVTPEVCRRYNLRDGIFIKGEIRRSSRGPQLFRLTEINGEDPEKFRNLPNFDELTDDQSAQAHQARNRAGALHHARHGSHDARSAKASAGSSSRRRAPARRRCCNTSARPW